MSSVLLLLWTALGAALGVFSLLVAERERKRGAARGPWSWMMLWALGIVLLSLSLLRLTVMVSS